MATTYTKIQIRRGDTVPTLAEGELFLDTANDLLFIGTDGGNVQMNVDTDTITTINGSDGTVVLETDGRITLDQDGKTFTIGFDDTDLLTSIALNDLTDVNTAGLDTNSILKYNGTNWVVEVDNYSGLDAASITSTDISNWDTAYGWGDHSTEGYITAPTTETFITELEHEDTYSVSTLQSYDRVYAFLHADATGAFAEDGYHTNAMTVVDVAYNLEAVTRTVTSETEGTCSGSGICPSYTDQDTCVLNGCDWEFDLTTTYNYGRVYLGASGISLDRYSPSLVRFIAPTNPTGLVWKLRLVGVNYV